MESKIAVSRGHAIMCGFGRVGSRRAVALAQAQKPFVVLEEREEHVRKCSTCGQLALQGDVTSDAMLYEAGIGHAKSVLVATDTDAHTICIPLSARHLNRNLLIVARASHIETEVKLELAGATRLVSPDTIAGQCMAGVALEQGGVA
jgi:voltage-gated potassium channel